MPCSGLGTGCDEVFPRERVVELLRPPTRAKFLKGLEAGGRILERQCYEEQLEKLRKELAEAREREGGSEEDAVVRHVNALADMQADCCPHCGCAFTDFTGCFVVSCGNTRCGASLPLCMSFAR